MAAGDRGVGAGHDINDSANATGDRSVAQVQQVNFYPQSPPPPPAAPIGNIPAHTRPFEGREAEVDWLRVQLIDGRQPHVVIHGQPGVGKSELAREFARRHRADFPGGCFFLDMTSGDAPLDLLPIARQQLKLDLQDGIPVQEQCQFVLLTLAERKALLIFDNASDPSVVDRWLPPHGSACRVLVTSARDVWMDGRPHRQLLPLNREEAGRLVRSIAGGVTDAQADAVLAQADGLPVQLAPAAAALGKSVRRGGRATKGVGVMPETLGSFDRALAAASPSARLLLHALGRCNAQGTPRGFVERMMGEVLGWSVDDVEERLDACADLYLLELGDTVRWHQLLGQHLRGTMPDETEAATLLQWQWDMLVSTANAVAENPTRSDQVAILRAFTLDPGHWHQPGLTGQARALRFIGRALTEIGQFGLALLWYEQSATLARLPDADGKVDQQSLGNSLHHVGFCHSSLGQYDAALPWYQQAVEAARQGDIHGRVNQEGLGSSLHGIGFCHSSQGRYDEALPWYQQAVEAVRQGDIHERVDQASLGWSLHQVGFCHTSQGRHVEALPWYKLAVEAGRQGDIHGRVDQAILGRSLHQVGVCNSSQGRHDEALHWFQQAVEAKRQGDIHRRVDQDSLGKSLFRIADCMRHLGQSSDAKDLLIEAVAAAEKGDVFGRVDDAFLRTVRDELATFSG